MLPIWLCVNFHSSCCWYEYIVGRASQWQYLLTYYTVYHLFLTLDGPQPNHTITRLRPEIVLFVARIDPNPTLSFPPTHKPAQPSPNPTQLNSHSMTCQFRKENFSNRMRIIYALAISLPIHPLNFKFICQLLIGFRLLLPFWILLCVSARSVAEREEC